MQIIDYKTRYIYTYIWQFLSIILGFLSLFIVVPYLSSDKTLYGIYSVCTSLTIFFSYADLGFISAGLKYGGEYYVRGETNEEIKMIGFVSFVMLVFFSMISLGLLYCSIYPNIILPELIKNSNQFFITRNLLIILALSCPIIICQRILLMIYSIRVESYKLQRITIIGSLIKILSVLYFFRTNHYDLVEYFLFTQIINFIVVLVAMYHIRNYGYEFSLLLKAVRYDKTLFDKTKKLSMTSFLMVICMILYYEIDQLFIARYIGLNAVSTYAIVLTVLSLIRSYISLIYSPYSSRYNHFIGISDYDGLNKFVKKNIYFLSPIICCSILTLSLLAEPFVISWVGSSYKESVALISIISFSFIPNFIINPVSSYFLANENNSYLIKWNIIMVIIYWIGIVTTYSNYGLLSFAIFKVVAPFICMIGYLQLLNKDYRHNGYNIITTFNILKNIFFPILFNIIICCFAIRFMYCYHSKLALIYNIFIIIICFITSMLFTLLTNRGIKEYCKTLIRLKIK